MDARHLFQLGTTDLGSGTAQKEGVWDRSAERSPALHRETGNTALKERPRPAETPGHRPPDAALAGNTEADHFIRRDGKVFAGTHLIIEVIDGTGLDDQARIEQAFRDCVDKCGATLLHMHLHRFQPQGVSGVAVLAESHISVHTWPERGYGAFDVFMCGDADPHQAVPVLAKAFSAGEVRVRELLRGEGLVGA
ncbi:MAG: adenosylmethionine decarboxylase [Pseudomonadota bacterium]